MDLTSLIESLKNLISSDQRYTLLVFLFSSVIIWYQFNLNKTLEEKIANNETRCAEMISKTQESCQEQINSSRARQQEQLDNFIIKSNQERDSLYTVFRKLIYNSNNKIKKSLTELDELKDENTN
jgi:hypothetical protein